MLQYKQAEKAPMVLLAGSLKESINIRLAINFVS